MSKVLLVEDEPIQLELISDRLKLDFEGIDLDTTESMHEAQELISQNNYAVIITDLLFGDYSASDTIKQIATSNPESKIIVYTVAPENFPSAYRDSDQTFVVSKLLPFEQQLKELLTKLLGSHLQHAT